MKRERIIITIFCVGFILSFYWLNLYLEYQGNIILEKELATVTRIIDGDTIETDLGIVRLIGINTPERNEKFFKESSDFLNFLLDEKVYLIRVKENRDRYKRLLRYIEYYDPYKKEYVLINEEIVQQGLAQLYYFDYDIYYERLKKAEEYARNNEKNIWEISSHKCSQCLVLKEIDIGLGKNDCNSGEEYILIQNNCGFSCDLSSWIIHDDSNRRFVFPDFVLNKDSEIKIYNGIGEDGIGYFFHNNRPSFGCYALWNDDKDTFYLRDNKENLVLFYRYGYE